MGRKERNKKVKTKNKTAVALLAVSTGIASAQGMFSGLANRQDEIKNAKPDIEWIVKNYDPSVLLSAELARKDDGTPDIGINSEGETVVSIKLDVNEKFVEWKNEATNRLAKYAEQIVGPGQKVEGASGSREKIVIDDITFVMPSDMEKTIKDALELRATQSPGVCVFLLDVDGAIVAEPKTYRNKWSHEPNRHELETQHFPDRGPLESIQWLPTFIYKGAKFKTVSFGKLSKSALDSIQEVRGCVGKQVDAFWEDQAELAAKQEAKRAIAREKTGQVVQDELDIAGIKYRKADDGTAFIATYTISGGGEIDVFVGTETYKSADGVCERREIWAVAGQAGLERYNLGERTGNPASRSMWGSEPTKFKECIINSGGKFLGHWYSTGRPPYDCIGNSDWLNTLIYMIKIPADAEAPVVKAAIEECASVAGKMKKKLQ